MRGLKSTVTLGAITLSSWMAACDGDQPLDLDPKLPTAPADVQVTPFEARFDERGAFVVDPQIPPAWRRDKTLTAQKGDQYDNERAQEPQHFAITEPPTRPVRAMVEWEPMQALAMSFPGYMLSATNATATVVQIAKVGSAYGPIWIFVDGAQAESGLRQKLASAGMTAGEIDEKITFNRVSFDSIWFIDSGPLPIIDETDDTFAFADFRYYHERPLDDGLPTWIGRNLVEKLGRPSNVPTYRMPLNVEGGTFQSTSDGICITGSRQLENMSCLAEGCDYDIVETDIETLQSNPYLLEMKAVWKQYAGCHDVIVTHSITDDGTGHIDMYLKILDDNRILLGQYSAESSNAKERENAALLDETAAYLEAYVKPDGTHFTVERLVMPGHRNSTSFGSVPFTYINSTFFNGVNLWPATTYSNWESSRDAAQAKWDEVLPNMTNVWIDATELSFYSGAIHCITRTFPAKTESLWVADGSCSGGACAAPTGGYDDECRPEGVDEDICWGPEWLCDCNDCESGCDGTVTPDACQGVTYQGCCESGDVVYCDGGELYRQPCGNTGCGWNDQGGYYDCDRNGQDPTGDFPIVCGAQGGDCTNKECGDDGAGGSCGDCGQGSTCEQGQCVQCDDCTAGTTGCDGATAWSCQAGANACNTRTETDCGDQAKVCDQGQCVDAPVEPGPEPTPEQGGDAATSGGDATSDGDLAAEGPRAVGKKDEGCAAGGGDLAVALAGLGLAFASRRRRVSR